MDKRDSFIFYRSFFESTKPLKKNEKAELFDAICSYALDQKESELKPMPKAMFTLIQPQLDANYKKYLNGKKPKQNKSEPEANDKQTGSKTEGNVNGNVNDNDNVNPNVNDNIPTEAVFIAYAIEQVKDIKTEAVRLKYRAWVESDWHTGGDKPKPIKNWKTTLLNTLPHMEKNAGTKPFKYEY